MNDLAQDDEHARIRGLFLGACPLAGESRAEYLAALAPDDRREVESLLAYDVPDHRLPEEPTVPSADKLPEKIGPYQVLDLLGEGGMGTVYLAEQPAPLRRLVALKVIKLGMDSRAVLKRFELERQALAVMNHENIARVFDAGTTERGQPYFAMEYAPGVPIDEYCDSGELSIEDRTRLMQQVCTGVQHAHQKGVIHRDLKPANILVAEVDGRPIAKIIDFGLARATDHTALQPTMFTEYGQIMGTLEYMSPEQACPGDVDIDTRTDVYALGVILCELLVGCLPFAVDRLRPADLLEIQRRRREEDPPRPSDLLSTRSEEIQRVAAARSATPAALRHALRTDLDWVVLKAIDRERNRRYVSAAALASDLERYLDDEALSVRPPGVFSQLVKWRPASLILSGAVIGYAVGATRMVTHAIFRQQLIFHEALSFAGHTALCGAMALLIGNAVFRFLVGRDPGWAYAMSWGVGFGAFNALVEGLAGPLFPELADAGRGVAFRFVAGFIGGLVAGFLIKRLRGGTALRLPRIS